MNVIVGLFNCFLLVFAFSFELRESTAGGVQQQRHHHDRKKGNIEGSAERKWVVPGGGATEGSLAEVTTEATSAKGSHRSPYPHKPAWNLATASGPVSLKSEKPMGSPVISIGWGPLISEKIKKKQNENFHNLMCIADCKMAHLLAFNVKNESASNLFLNMPLPGRPYTYKTLMDWCKENCGSSYGWMIPMQQSKPSTTTKTVAATPLPRNVLVPSYQQEVQPINQQSYKPTFVGFKPPNYKQFHFPSLVWQQGPIFSTMPDRQILRYEEKSPIFRTLLPTIIIPPMPVTKQSFLPYPEVVAPPPPPPPAMMYRRRDLVGEDAPREIVPSMSAPEVIGMNFRMKGNPFFAGGVLKQTGRSNIVPEDYQSRVVTRSENDGGKADESVTPDTEEPPAPTKEEEEDQEYEEEDEEDDKQENVATAILNLMRDLYKLITSRGVRTLLNILFCTNDSRTSVNQNGTSRAKTRVGSVP